jgi:hypothetical protein
VNYDDYQTEYKREAAEMKLALAEFNTAQGRVMVIQKRMAALHVLMELCKPLSELSPAQRRDIELSEQVMHATTKPADAIRRIFLAADGPLTPGEIRAELLKGGYDISRHKNIGAMIDSVCKRLAEQGFVVRRDNGARKTWEKVI